VRWGEGKYRTFVGTMTFLVAIVAKELWLLGTVGGEMPGLLAATTSDGGKVLGSHGFRALARIVTLSSERLADNSRNRDKRTMFMERGG
jgi:hypothetical protein